MAGFWLRGAVTIGLLHHDEDIVFGPALNRAYELESRHAIFPRIILDPACAELFETGDELIGFDQEFSFIDPFRPVVIDRIQQEVRPDPGVVARFNELSGGNVPQQPMLVGGTTILAMMVARLNADFQATSDERVRFKIRWLLDQIERRL